MKLKFSLKFILRAWKETPENKISRVEVRSSLEILINLQIWDFFISYFNIKDDRNPKKDISTFPNKLSEMEDLLQDSFDCYDTAKKSSEHKAI